MKEIGYTRSKVSRLTGISERNLRYYEKKKLLNPDIYEKPWLEHKHADVRYSFDELTKAAFISNYLSVGFQISQIQDVFQNSKSFTRKRLLNILDEQIDLLNRKIDDIKIKIDVLLIFRMKIILNKYVSKDDLEYLARWEAKNKKSLNLISQIDSMDIENNNKKFLNLLNYLENKYDDIEDPIIIFEKSIGDIVDYYKDQNNTSDIRILKYAIKQFFIFLLCAQEDSKNLQSIPDNKTIKTAMDIVEDYFATQSK